VSCAAATRHLDGLPLVTEYERDLIRSHSGSQEARVKVTVSSIFLPYMKFGSRDPK